MTAYPSEENRIWLLTMEMGDFVRKPVRVADLVRVLRASSAGAGREGPVHGPDQGGEGIA